MATVSFLGVGNMGFGMASCLIKAGHDVRVYNRTEAKAKPLVNMGAEYCATPRQAASGAEFLVAMVSDDAASREIWLGEKGAINELSHDRPVVIECSTLSHEWVLKLSTKLIKKGYTYLDCPVTGLPDAALAGQLVLFLGGDDETISRSQPVLSAMSSRQVKFGGIGSATAYKLIVNLMGSVQIVAAAEGLLAAEKAGLDLVLVAHELGIGGAGSPQVARNAALMVRGEHHKDITFNAKLRLKDTQYGNVFSQQLGYTETLGALTEQAFDRVINAGDGELAESKVIDLLREIKPKY